MTRPASCGLGESVTSAWAQACASGLTSGGTTPYQDSATPASWDCGGMQNRLSTRGMQPRAWWLSRPTRPDLWFFGHLYEAVVDMPQLLADAQPNRKPRLLGAGSPLRYYLPIGPVTFVATSAALIDKAGDLAATDEWRLPPRQAPPGRQRSPSTYQDR